MFFTKVFHEGKELSNERLELTDKGSLYFLGANLTLRHCSIILKVPSRNLFTRGVSFIDCTFEVKQELKNHQEWIFAAIKGCQFKGRFSGCDFGKWPGYSEGWENGSIEDCDFTDARLDGCRFMSCDPKALKFPKWPCFTILEPLRVASELRGAGWPGRFGELVMDTLDEHPAPTRALTLYAPEEARRFKTTPEDIRAAIERFDCIVY
jgi:hypothetical protein